MKKRIFIIGSGFGGLGAANLLASNGHDVQIFEKLDKPGGRAYVFKKDGFTFDAGPTVVTAPFLFDEIFEAAGKKRENYFELVPCEPFYRIFNHEMKYLDYNADENFILSEIEKWNPDDKQGYQKFIKTTKAIFQKGFVELADKPFLSFWDMMKVVPDLIKLQSHKSVYRYVSQFIKDDFLRRCFSFHPLLVGGNPFDTTSIYSMIHYLERKWGVYYAMGGTGSIVNALSKLLEEQGGKIHLNSEVDEILIDGKKALGVLLKDGTVQEADIIISNSDVAYTYRNMIPDFQRKKYSDKKLEKMRYSMSLFVIYFGTKRQYRNSNLRHHNIILSKRYKGLLEDIFHKKVLSDDFSLYLHVPSLTDPSVAPDGCESFYVLSPVPNLQADIDWESQAQPYRDVIMQFLEDNYLPDLQENLTVEHYIDPLHFQNVLNSYRGSAFSIEPTLTQSAWFRPHNQSEDFDNLYFVGAGTHPGAGLPGVLSSAKIVRDLIGKA